MEKQGEVDVLHETSARIIYYGREGYYKKMEISAAEASIKTPHELQFKFYQGLSLYFQKHSSESLRFLTPLLSDSTLGIGSMLAAISAHRTFQNVDKEEVASLESKLREARKSGNAQELYYGALFLYLCGRFDKSREYLDRSLKYSNNSHLDSLSLRGWIQIDAQSVKDGEKKDVGSKSPADYFDTALATNRKHLDSRLGLSRVSELCRDYAKSIDELNAILALSLNWLPALTEKMKIYVAMQDWDQVMENAHRILSIDGSHLEAHRVKILYSLCREGNIGEVLKGLDSLFVLSKTHDSKNSGFFHENAQIFSQLGSYSGEVVEKCVDFIKHASELDVENEELVSEVGNIYLLLHRVDDAQTEFKRASNLAPASLSPLIGCLKCQIWNGEISLAAEQLSFLSTFENTNKNVELPYLRAILSMRSGESAESTLTHLSSCVELYSELVEEFPLNLKFIKRLKPDLIINIVKQFLIFAPQEPILKGGELPVGVLQASLILEILSKICPAHPDGLFIGAYIKYLSGEFEQAHSILNRLKKFGRTNESNINLLLAQIHIAENNYEAASDTLSLALSSDFSIRMNPKYSLLRAKIEVHSKDPTSAKSTLENALRLFSENSDSDNNGGFKSPFEGTSLGDEFEITIELMGVLRLLGQTDEAEVLMEKASTRFQGSYLEGRLSLTGAESLIEKGDSNGALESLHKVLPTQHHFVEAQKLMADIYLNYKRDRRAYIACYTQIVTHFPTPHHLVLLGEAYMNIQEPNKAIESFESALKKRVRDPLLTRKLGEALVKTHQFSKAISFYQDAIKSPENFSLRLDLASLQFKLGKWDGGEKTLQEALGDLKETGISKQILEVQLLTLLAKVQRGGGNYHQAQQTLLKCKDFQSRALKHALLEAPESLDKMRTMYGEICKLIGETAERPNELDYAIKSLREAIELRPADSGLLTALARLYLKTGDYTHCQQTCMQLMSQNPESDANIMLGELYFRRGDFPNSLEHFQKHLIKNANSWESLAWYIEACRRSGVLSEAETLIQKSVSRFETDSIEPGLAYCQGLFEWYKGNVNGALKHLNKARRDGVYGQRSILLIIDIYLNPTGTVLGGDSLDSSSTDTLNLTSNSASDPKEIVAKTIESLLKELTIKSGEDKFRRQILECYALIITKNKNKVEKAIQELSGLVTTDVGRDSVMLIHALSIANIFVKQVPRARNQLKRLSKSAWNIEDAEYLERSWLLLASIYIQSSKYDLATELIRRVGQFNRSSVRASELLGLIMEKEQAYADAASNYETAWEMTRRADGGLGFKLAFNYLKAKRFTDAIDVCHIVLAKNPNFPKIRKEILEKARSSLRV